MKRKKALVHDVLHSTSIDPQPRLFRKNPRTDYPLPLEATLSPSQSSPYPNQQWNGSEGHWNIRTKRNLPLAPLPLPYRTPTPLKNATKTKRAANNKQPI